MFPWIWTPGFWSWSVANGTDDCPAPAFWTFRFNQSGLIQDKKIKLRMLMGFNWRPGSMNFTKAAESLMNCNLNLKYWLIYNQIFWSNLHLKELLLIWKTCDSHSCHHVSATQELYGGFAVNLKLGMVLWWTSKETSSLVQNCKIKHGFLKSLVWHGQSIVSIKWIMKGLLAISYYK